MPPRKRAAKQARQPELWIITGLSGSGKGTVLRSMEDLGFYAVDNLPIDFIGKFAELIRDSAAPRGGAVVVDIREGQALRRFPDVYKSLHSILPTRLVFLEAETAALVRRFSETRRPHPLGTGRTVARNLESERQALEPIRQLADLVLDTSRFNVHELRESIVQKFHTGHAEAKILIQVTSFGFRNGLPTDADLVLDVRFLPNPNYIPELKGLTGRHHAVARFIRNHPQTQEFLSRLGELLTYLLPHYIREGKSYLTIAFGCTGGQHRSVMMAEDVRKRLAKAGYRVKVTHRDMKRA